LQVFLLLFGKSSHHLGLSAPLQPRFCSLRLTAFPKAKIAVEMEEICECEGHTVHKLSQRRLTATWLAPRVSECSQMRSKVSSDWLPSYINATRPVLDILKTDRYFPNSLRIPVKICWAEVQSCIVHMRWYSYVLLCFVWLEPRINLTFGLL
jgi:hypothetical protein